MELLPNELLYFILSYCAEYTVYLGGVCKLWREICRDLVVKGNYSFLDLLERGCQEEDPLLLSQLSRSYFRAALREGKLNIISTYERRASRRERKRLRERVIFQRRFILSAHLRTIQYYYPRLRFTFYISQLEGASIERDDPLFLDWLQRKMFIDLDYVFFRSLRLGKVKLLTYLEEEVDWRNKLTQVRDIVLIYRSLPSFLWLRERGILFPSCLDFLVEAVKEERLDILEQFWEEVEIKKESLLEQSIFYGKTEVFLWLLERTKNTPLQSSLFILAGEKKTRDLLFSLGCPWSKESYYNNIFWEDIEGLRWLIDRYPPNPEIIEAGLFSRSQKVREFFFLLLRQRREHHSFLFPRMAMRKEDRTTLSRLIKLGCPLDEKTEEYARSIGIRQSKRV